MSTEATLRIQRGDKDNHQMVEYKIPLNPGMVVLDAVHAIQATEAPDLADTKPSRIAADTCEGRPSAGKRPDCLER